MLDFLFRIIVLILSFQQLFQWFLSFLCIFFLFSGSKKQSLLLNLLFLAVFLQVLFCFVLFCFVLFSDCQFHCFSNFFLSLSILGVLLASFNEDRNMETIANGDKVGGIFCSILSPLFFTVFLANWRYLYKIIYNENI